MNYSYHTKPPSAPKPFLRIGIDSTMNNLGSQYSSTKDSPGLEKEQCMTTMDLLQWNYQFVQYDNQIGTVLSNGTATGMLGDIQNGVIDMICGRYVMTTDRINLFSFPYPIQVEVTQVYLINPPTTTHDVEFALRPFSSNVWFAIIVAIILMTLLFVIIRFVEAKEETFLSVIYHSIAHMISLITDLHITGHGHTHSTFHVFQIATGIWLIVWVHFIIDVYIAELREILIVSDKWKPPFTDFDGLVEQLKSGSFRFLTQAIDQIPICPEEYSINQCHDLFAEIFKKHPPVIGSADLLNNDAFIASQDIPLVTYALYPGTRLTSQFSLWTQNVFKTNVWVISDFSTEPASWPLSQNFSQLNELNQAILTMFPVYAAIDNHYTPAYPAVQLTQQPKRMMFRKDEKIIGSYEEKLKGRTALECSAFTISQLTSIFYLHLIICGAGLIVFIIENVIVRFRISSVIPSEIRKISFNREVYWVTSPSPRLRYFRKDLMGKII